METVDRSTQETIKHRIITMLDRKEIDFLDTVGKDALFSTGHKLSHSEILRGLVEFAMQIGISGEKIDSISVFTQKLLQQAHKAEALKNNVV